MTLAATVSERLPLAAIHVDPELQLRGGLDMDRIIAMTEFEEHGGHLPPITVVGDDNLLADGHHRLYAADRSGRLDIDVERLAGDRDVAIVAAIQRNDLATAMPLTRTGRNKGIKLLLQAGWTQEHIATATGVHRTTIVDIHNALAMRGQVAKGTEPSRGAAGGRTPKPVTVLPPEVADKLGDTVLVRIATSVPLNQQTEFATAVADAGLSEPAVRAAIKVLRGDPQLTPTQAVAKATPRGDPVPSTMHEVATQARRRLTEFLAKPMTVDGTPRDFWAVLEVLAEHGDLLPAPATATLAALLAEVAVKADHYATRLQSADALHEVTA